MNDRERVTEECLDYLKSEPVFRRMLDGFVKKYESYGGFRGSVKVVFRNDGEREAMEGLLGRNFHGKKSASVSAAALEKALEQSRFAGTDPGRLILRYAGGRIVVPREEDRRKKTVFADRIRRTRDASADPVYCRLLGEILETGGRRNRPEDEPVSSDPSGGDAERVFRTLYHNFTVAWEHARETGAGLPEEEAVPALQRDLDRIGEILKRLPVREHSYRYLAVFASDATGDPHAFDRGSAGGNLLEKLLRWYAGGYPGTDHLTDLPDTFASVRRGNLFLRCGILIDDVSNFATLYGVDAVRRGGERDAGMSGFHAERAAVSVPLAVVMEWERVSCGGNRIRIVENPSIFSIFISRYPEQSFMCMNGQPKLAGLVFLHLLVRSGVEVSYSGDLDPEGVSIADRLWLFSGKRLRIRRMAPADYLGHLDGAGKERTISERRLKMLAGITHPVLRETAAEIRKHKKAVYQENLLADIL